jgi:LmbE family N-acetylglucosaminyl deacetylase
VLRDLDALPFGTLDELIGPGRPLILAPHPDDESLGCGGLIAACSARGRPPCIVVVTDGTGSHPASRTHPPERLRAVREQEARAAAQHLGIEPDTVVFLRLRDTAVPSEGAVFDAAVSVIIGHLRAAMCSVILAPWRHDPHCDHVAADAMARQVARIAGIAHLSYPVWGWTLPPDSLLPDEPLAGWRLDISEQLDAKRAAIVTHRSQYSNLITDDPTGFRLPANLIAIFTRPHEVFVRA